LCEVSLIEASRDIRAKDVMGTAAAMAEDGFSA
jgi:hypothetical protein